MKNNYLRSTLQPGERIICRGKIHPAFLFAPTLWALVIAAGVLKGIRAFDLLALSPWLATLLLLPLIYFAQHLITYLTTEASLTSHRVISKTGWLSRTISEVSLGKIESTAIDQPVIGRLFGFANLVVKGSGGHAVTATALADVMKFRAAIQTATNPR